MATLPTGHLRSMGCCQQILHKIFIKLNSRIDAVAPLQQLNVGLSQISLNFICLVQ